MVQRYQPFECPPVQHDAVITIQPSVARGKSGDKLGGIIDRSLFTGRAMAQLDQFLHMAGPVVQHIRNVDECQEDLVSLLEQCKSTSQPTPLRNLKESMQVKLEAGAKEAEAAQLLMQQLVAFQQETMQHQDDCGPGTAFEGATAGALGDEAEWLKQLADGFASFREQMQDYELTVARRKVGVATGKTRFTDKQMRELLQSDDVEFRRQSLDGMAMEEKGMDVVIQILMEAKQAWAVALQLDSCLSKIQQSVQSMAGIAAGQALRAQEIDQVLAQLSQKTPLAKSSLKVYDDSIRCCASCDRRWLAVISFLVAAAAAVVVILLVMRSRT